MLCLKWRGSSRAAVFAVMVMMALGSLAPAGVWAQATDDKTYEFDIPAQALARSVAAVAAVTGYEVLYTETEPLNVEAQAVTGRMTVDAALSQLLTGTGFTYRYTQPRVITLERVQTGEVDGVRVLSPVRVEGAQNAAESPRGARYGPGKGNSVRYRNPQTEGTGSYTTGGVTVAAGEPVSLQEVPNSVSVVTREILEDEAVTTVGDALRFAPGVIAQDVQTGYTRVYIRGFDANYTIDGVTQTNTPSNVGFTNLDTILYDRIEVRRGADGLLRGSGSPGGTIALVRRQTSDVFGADLRATTDRWGTLRGELTATGPITRDKKLQALTAVVFDNRKFYYGSLDSFPSGLASASLKYAYAAGSHVMGSVDYHQSDTPFYNGIPYGPNGEVGVLPRDIALVPSWATQSRNRVAYTLDAQHKFDENWTVRIAARTESVDSELSLATFSTNYDLASNTVPAFALSIDSNQWYRGVDVNLSGKFEFLDARHEVYGGVNWRDNENWHRQGIGPIVLPVIGFSRSNEPGLPSITLPDARTRIADENGVHTSIRSYFGDAFIVLGGIRLSNYHNFDRAPILPVPVTEYREKWVPTPFAGLIFKPVQPISLYASYSRQFTSNGTLLSQSGDQLEPSKGFQWEGGVKGEFLDGRLNASAAYFATYRSDIAVRDPAFPEGVNFYFNAARERSTGIDLEVSGEVTAGTQVLIAYTENDPRYDLYPGREQLIGTSFVNFIPKRNYRAVVDHRFRRWLPEFSVGGSFYGQSAIDGKKVNARYPYAPAYTVFNAHAAYRLSEHVELSANLNNLFDKWYLSGIGGSATRYGVPRELIVSIGTKF